MDAFTNFTATTIVAEDVAVDMPVNEESGSGAESSCVIA